MENEHDAAEYTRTLDALRAFGMSDEEVNGVMRVVAGTMHVGELRYFGTEASLSSGCKQSGRMLLLEEALGLPTNSLVSIFLSSGTKKRRSSEEAKEASNGFARLLYSRLFDLLTARVNAGLAQAERDTTNDGNMHLGILDMFGFEVLARNGFEALMANYANEKLTLHVLATRSKVLEMFRPKGRRGSTDIPDINLSVNKDLIEMFEHPKKGVLTLLGNCADPKVVGSNLNDASLLTTIMSANRKSKYMTEKRRSRSAASFDAAKKAPIFHVRHSIAELVYVVGDFPERSRGVLADPRLSELMKRSTVPIVAELFTSDTGAKLSTEEAIASSTPIRAKAEIDELIKVVTSTRQRFIRCFNSNKVSPWVGGSVGRWVSGSVDRP